MAEASAKETAALACIICTGKLIAVEESKMSPGLHPASLPCGHVFHSRCIDKWIQRKRECPNCRAQLKDEQRVEKLFFDKDDDPAELLSEEEIKEEKPWYEKYATELVFGGGVLAGALLGGILGAFAGSSKEKKNKN